MSQSAYSWRVGGLQCIQKCDEADSHTSKGIGSVGNSMVKPEPGHKNGSQARKKQKAFLLCLFIWAATKMPPTFRVGLLVTIVAVKTIPTDVSTRQPDVHGPLLRLSYQITTPGCIKLLI